MFNMNDPTVRDRYTMLRIGERMIRSHPVDRRRPEHGAASLPRLQRIGLARRPRRRDAHQPAPAQRFLQVAAERGLPAFALWLWFIVALLRDVWRRFNTGQRELAATAMATIVALLTAGLFEYNFGDSEV
jgi:hypothetical protein